MSENGCCCHALYFVSTFIGLSFLERPYLVLELNFILILYVNRQFTDTIYKCKLVIYRSVNQQFTAV